MLMNAKMSYIIKSENKVIAIKNTHCMYIYIAIKYNLIYYLYWIHASIRVNFILFCFLCVHLANLIFNSDDAHVNINIYKCVVHYIYIYDCVFLN